MRERITEIMFKIAEEQNPTLPRPIEIKKGADAGLYGPSGVLDSLALVAFIVELEVMLEDEFGVAVVLANERAMSQKSSPFLTIGSLAGYAEEVLKEAGAHGA